jgi:hypothetical protein
MIATDEETDAFNMHTWRHDLRSNGLGFFDATTLDWCKENVSFFHHDIFKFAIISCTHDRDRLFMCNILSGKVKEIRKIWKAAVVPPVDLGVLRVLRSDFDACKLPLPLTKHSIKPYTTVPGPSVLSGVSPKRTVPVVGNVASKDGKSLLPGSAFQAKPQRRELQSPLPEPVGRVTIERRELKPLGVSCKVILERKELKPPDVPYLSLNRLHVL